jgi:GNAT superfamily N-acetyltransferase
MSGRRVIGKRTYLEMHDRAHLVRARLPDAPWAVDRMLDCAPAFWRFLYSEIGREHQWVDRLPWTTQEISAYLADPQVSIWLLRAWASPAGYFELRRDADNGVEIAYFGLLKHFHGRGLGGHFLSEAVARAWDAGAQRVWLHTNTFDHASALPNYLKRGFTVFRTEDYMLDV